MKFLVDENLPPTFAVWLCAQGHDAVHVVRANLRGAADSSITDVALRSDRVVVTRDSDFDRADTRYPGVRVLRLTLGNCTNAALISWTETRLETALARLENERFVIVD